MSLDRETFLFLSAAIAAGILLAGVVVIALVAVVRMLGVFSAWLDGPAIDPYRVEREIVAAQRDKSKEP